MTTVLVTGATGNVGSRVVGALRRRGVFVRAFVRDPNKAKLLLGDDVEVAVGDFADSASVRSAVRGVDRVFLTSGDGWEKVAYETAVIDAAAAARVPLIVKMSTIGARAGSSLPGFDWHGRIEQHLHESGVPAVILQANILMSNLLAAADTITSAGKLFAPADGGKVSMIDPRDVADVAAVTLTVDGHEGHNYELTGPAAITYDDVARELSIALRRPVEFVDVPAEAAGQAFVDAGMPDWLITHLTGAFELIRQGALEQTTDLVRSLAGREPRTFAQFARDHSHLFTAAATVATETEGQR